jgi:hypothetical protein
MSVTRRPGTGIATPTVVRNPNGPLYGHSALLSRAGFAHNAANTTPDPLRRSTTLPALSSPTPTRLPTARNSPAFGAPPLTPRPRMLNGTSGLGTAGAGTAAKRGTAVQMVGEMRARVRTLEQKINRVPLPRIRNVSYRPRTAGGSKENAGETDKEREKEDKKARRNLDVGGTESPGWVIVTDGPSKGMDDDLPSPSPSPREPLVERPSFASERTNTSERKRTSFSSDRERRSLNEDPPPSAFRGMSDPQPDIPSGRTTPASTVGSNRVVSRTGASGFGRATHGLGITSSSSLFGMTIRRPQSRNASHNSTLAMSTRGGHIPPPLPSIPSLSRIPSSPLPGTSDESIFFPGRPTTPTSGTMLPVPTDRSPSKSDNFTLRKSTRRLSLHPSGHGGRGSATSPTLPAGMTGGSRSSASVGGTRKPVYSPPRAGAGKGNVPAVGSSQNILGMSRIGRPNSIGVPSGQTGAAGKEKQTGRFRSGSVGWGRDR